MDLSKAKVFRNSKVSWQKIDDKIIVVSPQERKIHILAESGVSIWEYLVKPRKIDEIAALISKEYEVSIAQAEQDIRNFIITLKDKNLVAFK